MRVQSIGSQPIVDARQAARSERLVAAVMAALFGIFLVWGVGFSPVAALHNAAHDTRHSLAFPCH
jgi:cobalt transporter subunit CbtB